MRAWWQGLSWCLGQGDSGDSPPRLTETTDLDIVSVVIMLTGRYHDIHRAAAAARRRQPYIQNCVDLSPASLRCSAKKGSSQSHIDRMLGTSAATYSGENARW